MNKTLFFMSLFTALNFGNLPNAAFKHKEISYKTVIKNNEEVFSFINGSSNDV